MINTVKIEKVPDSEDDYGQEEWDEFELIRYDLARYQAWELPSTVGLGVSGRYEVIAVALVDCNEDETPCEDDYEEGEEEYQKVIGAVYGGISLGSGIFSMDVIVLPQYKRKGIGKDLIWKGIEHYKGIRDDYEEAHERDLIFEVHVVNPILIPFFKKVGFTIFQTSPNSKEVLMRY